MQLIFHPLPKHPPSGMAYSMKLQEENINAEPAEALRSVITSSNGSAGGLNVLSAQHLKNLLGGSTGAASETLLTELINLMLSGSVTGCQQGAPLGPAIFSLAIFPIINILNSKCNMWCLNNGTLEGEFLISSRRI